jgi:glutathione S-transferase
MIRYLARYVPNPHEQAVRIAELVPRAAFALDVMERQLRARPFMAGATCTLADIALYPYTRWADEADIDLTPYAAVRAWLARVESEPRFLPLRAEGATQVVTFEQYFQT